MLEFGTWTALCDLREAGPHQKVEYGACLSFRFRFLRLNPRYFAEILSKKAGNYILQSSRKLQKKGILQTIRKHLSFQFRLPRMSWLFHTVQRQSLERPERSQIEWSICLPTVRGKENRETDNIINGRRFSKKRYSTIRESKILSIMVSNYFLKIRQNKLPFAPFSVTSNKLVGPVP